MATQAIITRVKVSEMDLVPATATSEVTGLQNGVNVRMSVASVLGTVTKEMIGLDKVENLAPSEMPISQLQQAALDNKMDKGSIAITDILGLPQALDAKLDKTGSIGIPQVTGLEPRLNALETGLIPVARISGLGTEVDRLIDARPDLVNEVVKGPMDW